MFNTIKRTYTQSPPGHADFRKWWKEANPNLTVNSATYAANFINAAATCSWYDKLIWLLPGLGSISGSTSPSPGFSVPLIDRKNKGNSFVSSPAQFLWSESTGLNKTPSTARIYTKYSISDINSGSIVGGLGVWMLGTIVGVGHPFSVVDNSVSPHRTYSAVSNYNPYQGFYGLQTAGPIGSGSLTSGNYLTQRTSTSSISIYKNGIKTGTTGSILSGSASTFLEICLFSELHYSFSGSFIVPSNSRYNLGCAYMTDGTMTDSEVTSFHNILTTTIMSASGKI